MIACGFCPAVTLNADATTRISTTRLTFHLDRGSAISSDAVTRVLFSSLVIVMGIAGSAPTRGGQASSAQVFAGATLFDGTGARIENAVMVARNGRIASVGRSDGVTLPKDARTTTLKGQFVIPGLISAHVHVSDV